MNIAVRYYSRGGNTKKLADAIAEAVGVEAETVDRPLDERTDVVFLGSSVYAGGIDESVKRFLRKNQSLIGTVYNFSTAAIAPSTFNQVKKLADECGIAVSDREFHCRGSFLLLHRGHPDKGDLTRAVSFAKLAVQKAVPTVWPLTAEEPVRTEETAQTEKTAQSVETTAQAEE